MPFLSKQDVFARYQADGRNSSHFVWFLDPEFRYFESSQDKWIFAFHQQSEVTLIALEPLIQGAPLQYGPELNEAFSRAWKEFCDEVRPSIAAFVAVYEPFAKLLREAGFQILKIGHEPWVDLKDCIPKGNSGKGVRAARNQALNAGLQIEEWPSESLETDGFRRETILSLFQQWKAKRPLLLSGFLNSTDPVAHLEARRYFVAKSKLGRVEGYLIATQVPGVHGYFLEDMVLRPSCPRGSGELLTLETMVRLGESGSTTASLGVVSVTSIDANSARGLPRAIEWLTVKLPQMLTRIYNFNGLETFRKRFNPSHWENIFLAVQNREALKRSDTRAWLSVFGALARAFRPRLNLTLDWLREIVAARLRRHPVSSGMFALTFTLFGLINHFGQLPQDALARFGFYGDAPFYQWFYRTFTSDLLYWEPSHFWIWGGLYFMVLNWAEKCHRRSFVFWMLLGISFADDFLNQWLIIHPFSFLKPELYEKLIQFKDVGGSLGLTTFIGLQICQFRRNRELIFAGMVVAVVFGFVFSALQYQVLVLNLNHFLFLVLGFTVGKVKFEWDRHKCQQASKGKPPIARTVAPRPAVAADTKKAA